MPERGTLSVDKARRIIGYRPQYPLEVGYRKYIQWYRGLFDRVKATPKVGLAPEVDVVGVGPQVNE